jgi:hypothetical protein
LKRVSHLRRLPERDWLLLLITSCAKVMQIRRDGLRGSVGPESGSRGPVLFPPVPPTGALVRFRAARDHRDEFI